jgi:hypothetical protein
MYKNTEKKVIHKSTHFILNIINTPRLKKKYVDKAEKQLRELKNMR